MPRYTARILSNNGGNYDAECYASNRIQAEENFRRQHDGNAVHITEVETSSSSSSSSSSSGGSGSTMDTETAVGAVVVLGGLVAFFMFMPWILMGAGGAAGAWLGEKLTGFNVTETELDTKNDEHMKKFGTILALSLLLGGIGFTTGHNFTNSSSSVDTVEEVRN